MISIEQQEGLRLLESELEKNVLSTGCIGYSKHKFRYITTENEGELRIQIHC